MALTSEQISNLQLGISPIDARTEIAINTGIEWLEEHTTIDVTDLNKFPYSAKLFLIKFYDLQKIRTGISSQSIEGLSQSFDTSDKNAQLWQFAEQYLSGYLKSCVRFVSATKKWR